MQKVEQVAKDEISLPEDYLQVCGALLAVTRNMYVEALGPYDAALIFETVAQSFKIQEDIIEVFRVMVKSQQFTDAIQVGETKKIHVG